MERTNGPNMESDKPGARPAAVKLSGSRGAWFSLRMHHLLFIAFTLVAAVPIAVLALWEGRTSFQNELDSVRERHLLVARNLTSTMSRYVKDLKSVFSVAIESGALEKPVAGLADLLTSLEVVHLCILAPDGHVESAMGGLSESDTQVLPEKLIADLRLLPRPGSQQTVLSNLYHDSHNNPVFYLVKSLAEGRTAVGVVRTRYLVSLQQAIAFGDHGHAVIVDAKGQVIAHPLKDWVAASRDISGVNVVAAMIRGQTGVDQFYSPAFHGDMIAGYAVVPETGWGVMVPQPISELQRRADQVNQMAVVIAVVSFIVAALVSWLLALYLARPVRAVASTAEAVLNGNDEVSVPEFRGAVPREIRRLGLAFNTMLTDLRRRAAETLAALRQAETSNKAKSQFLANMSHEIRTPLNGVVGMIELMRLTDLSAAQRGYTEQACQSSQALLRLIDDIMDLSRIEAGRLELERAPFHLPNVMQELRVLFAEQARAKSLTLSVSVPDDLNVVLIGDKHRLLQVMANLVGNAIKFTQQGSVTVKASRAAMDSGRATVRFDVTDTGIGVPKDQQAVIFDAFTQADTSMTRRYGGTGLGLSIARQLCHMMDGEIGVTSVVGTGSTFWFTVRMEIGSAAPRVPVPAIQAAPTAPAEPVPSHSGVSAVARDFQDALHAAGRTSVSILLVEDNPANMRVTKALLEILGCVITPAQNGLAAVEEYRKGTFDLERFQADRKRSARSRTLFERATLSA